MIARRDVLFLAGTGLAAALEFLLLKDVPHIPPVKINPKFDAIINLNGKSNLRIYLDPPQKNVVVHDNFALVGKLDYQLDVPFPFGETREYEFIYTPSGLSAAVKKRFVTLDEASSFACRLDSIDEEAGFIRAENMTPAFFYQDVAYYVLGLSKK